MSIDLSKSERELLKAVYRSIDAEGEGRTGDLAADLGVTAGTVSGLIKRLDEHGYVIHRPYKGVELTELGQRAALAAVRRHRIVERFLADMLGYDWKDASELAGTFEHDLPMEVEDRLFAALNRPESCPHGFPIPEREAAVMATMPPLYDLEPGATALVAVPGSTDPELVAFLDTLGLRPGVEIEVLEKHPFDGPLVVRVDGKDRTLGDTVAKQVFVQAATSPPPDNAHRSA